MGYIPIENAAGHVIVDQIISNRSINELRDEIKASFDSKGYWEQKLHDTRTSTDAIMFIPPTLLISLRRS
jgi:hypothetical protein